VLPLPVFMFNEIDRRGTGQRQAVVAHPCDQRRRPSTLTVRAIPAISNRQIPKLESNLNRSKQTIDPRSNRPNFRNSILTARMWSSFPLAPNPSPLTPSSNRYTLQTKIAATHTKHTPETSFNRYTFQRLRRKRFGAPLAIRGGPGRMRIHLTGIRTRANFNKTEGTPCV